MSFYEFLRNAPFVRLLLPVMAGIVAGKFFPVDGFVFIATGFLLVLIPLFLYHAGKFREYRLRWVWGMVINVVLIFSGMLLISRKNETVIRNGMNAAVSGVVLENPVVKSASYSVMVELELISINGTIIKSNDRVLCTLQKNHHNAPKINDRIVFRGEFKEIVNYGNPYEFDYRSYMQRNGFHFRVFADSSKWAVTGSYDKFRLTLAALQLREQILQYFRQLQLSPSAFAVISALTVGDKSYLDDELKAAYVNSGTMHLLAVSGMHVALLFWLLQQITRPVMFWRRGKFIRTVVVLGVIWLYALITGLTPSVVRASVMFTFWMLGDTANRNISVYNTLSASALLLLVINPFTLFDVGFQLSYMAVLGIVVFYNDIYRWIAARNMVARYLWSMISVSLAAQLFTLPLSLYYFHQFPNYFLLSNIVALPLSTVILYGSIGSLLFAPVKFLWEPAGWVLKNLVDAMNFVLLWIENLPGSVTAGLAVSGIAAVSLFAVVVFTRVFLGMRKAAPLMIAMLSLLVIFADLLQKYIRTSHSGEMVIYNTHGPLVIQLRQGYRNQVITDNASYNTSRLLKPYNEAFYLESPGKITLDASAAINFRNVNYYKGFLHAGNRLIYIWEKKPSVKSKVKVDILIINKFHQKDMDALLTMFQPDEVIITQGVYKAVANRIIAQIGNNVRCWYLAADGARVLPIAGK